MSMMQSANALANRPTKLELWRRRERVFSQAPRDLQALGVPHAWTAWQRACTELHNLRRVGLREARESLEIIKLALVTSIVAEERGEEGGWITPADVAEAHLRIAAMNREVL